MAQNIFHALFLVIDQNFMPQKNVFFSISIYVLWFKDIYKSFADLGMAQNILHALFLVIDQNFMPQECIPVGCVPPAH